MRRHFRNNKNLVNSTPRNTCVERSFKLFLASHPNHTLRGAKKRAGISNPISRDYSRPPILATAFYLLPTKCQHHPHEYITTTEDHPRLHAQWMKAALFPMKYNNRYPLD
ncbi:hypothetical protein CEXT_288491 [Caerostris extrusa]|uniref:Uncharacterized protein n=1 Tax=Caerostris extrusa TaxID=172846 RepID=A0AAV4U8E3_CAEEX|nr:hypothetical protein CEXT_288491 [Caerostris extrusa]